MWAIATAACRDARNGPAFHRRGASESAAPRSTCCRASARRSCPRSASFRACYKPDGIVGDLGGGSLELDRRPRPPHQAGRDAAARRPGAAGHLRHARSRRPRRSSSDALADVPALKAGARAHFLRGRRHLARACAACTCGRPAIRCTSCTATSSRRGRRSSSPAWCSGSIPSTLSQIEVVTDARRPLLAYAALVLEHVMRIARPKQVVISALGVREGLLYSLLSEKEKKRDALIAAAQELNLLRSRSPRHGEELIDWTDRFMASTGIDETAGGEAAAPRRLPARRYRLARASGLSRRAVAQHHRECGLRRRSIIRAAPFSRWRCSSAMSGCIDDELVAACARARHRPHARPRARARRRDARRLSGVGRDAGRAAATRRWWSSAASSS